MNKHILVVDDDALFCQVITDALQKRQFEAKKAHTIEMVEKIIAIWRPHYAVVDLRIGRQSGLKVCQLLLEYFPDIRIVMLTGFASIATAVEAIKLGVIQYLTKPTDLDAIIAALTQDEADTDVIIADTPLSVKRLEWEHLQKVLHESDGNVSKAAKKLNMHRRTLQRKLQKRPVKR